MSLQPTTGELASSLAQVAQEEATALQDVCQVVLQTLSVKSAEIWPDDALQATHIRRVLELVGGGEDGEPTADGVVTSTHAAALREIFSQLPKEELLASEIFTPVSLTSALISALLFCWPTFLHTRL
jgi:hypothetical protein